LSIFCTRKIWKSPKILIFMGTDIFGRNGNLNYVTAVGTLWHGCTRD
jgi:hypothetical protein